MFQELTTFYQNQEKTKIRWKRLKNNYFKIIYKDVLEHKTAKQIHKELMDSTINGSKKLLAYAMKVANKAVKLDKGKGKYDNLDLLAIPLIELFTRDAVNYKSDMIINKETSDEENDAKNKALDNAIKNGAATGKIWYVASAHKDSRPSHVKLQGKLYVDARWQQYDLDGTMGAYITAHNIQTIQTITSDPYWLVTGANCRHYFTQYTWNQIKHGRYHIPHRKIGSKALQTPAHANLQYYQSRLKMLQALWNVRPTPLLKKLIGKTKLLIKKWQGLI